MREQQPLDLLHHDARIDEGRFFLLHEEPHHGERRQLLAAHPQARDDLAGLRLVHLAPCNIGIDELLGNV